MDLIHSHGTGKSLEKWTIGKTSESLFFLGGGKMIVELEKKNYKICSLTRQPLCDKFAGVPMQ